MTAVDYVVIGAGHNGLVCAAYLARAGYEVTVLEARDDIGGCTRTISFPGTDGWKVNTCADVDIFFHPTAVPRELELGRFGWKPMHREVVFFAPFSDGSSLFIWRDEDRTAKEITRFSPRDAKGYRDYLAYWREAYSRLERVEAGSPPAPGDLVASLGGDMWAEEFFRLLVSPPKAVASEWFESPQMQGIMAWQTGLYHVSPDEPGAGLGLGHLAGCVLNGITRTLGGMGVLCNCLRRCLENAGGVVRTGARVREVVVDHERATGVRLDTGERIEARKGIVSSIDARRVLLDMLGEGTLDAHDRAVVQGITVGNIAIWRVSLALNEAPIFSARYGLDEASMGEALKSSIMLETDSWESIQIGWEQTRRGELADIANNMWIGIPTAMDPDLAGSRGHVVSFAEYVPYALAQGTWEERRSEAVDRVVASWERHAPLGAGQVRAVWSQTPEDLERETGNIHGHPFHIDQTFHQMFGLRPAPSLAQYRSPVEGLYLSGSGTHPGGGVTGLPGRNAAQAILSDLPAP